MITRHARCLDDGASRQGLQTVIPAFDVRVEMRIADHGEHQILGGVDHHLAFATADVPALPAFGSEIRRRRTVHRKCQARLRRSQIVPRAWQIRP
jgi:hypothetical protein